MKRSIQKLTILLIISCICSKVVFENMKRDGTESYYQITLNFDGSKLKGSCIKQQGDGDDVDIDVDDRGDVDGRSEANIDIERIDKVNAHALYNVNELKSGKLTLDSGENGKTYIFTQNHKAEEVENETDLIERMKKLLEEKEFKITETHKAKEDVLRDGVIKEVELFANIKKITNLDATTAIKPQFNNRRRRTSHK
jgi:hypothetical protein